jgi:hypothetical protein
MHNKSHSRGWLFLLGLPYVAVLWVGSYNRVEPELFGFPFFYWYQLLWVALCSGIVAVVFRMTRSERS